MFPSAQFSGEAPSPQLRRIVGFVVATAIGYVALSFLWTAADLTWGYNAISLQNTPDENYALVNRFPTSWPGYMAVGVLERSGMLFIPAVIVVALLGAALLATAFVVQRRVR